MVRQIIALLVCLALWSCKEEGSETKLENVVSSTDEKSSFKMYDMSQMSLLMEQMFVYNQRIKDKILEGIAITDSMPSLHYKLLSSETTMTDPSERDDFFEQQAKKYIEIEEEFYQNPTINTKEKFNAIVSSCLECHAKKCGGPVPRIKKLLIP